MKNDISFTAQIKEEISTFSLKKDEARSLIAGFLTNAGTISFLKNKKIVLSSENSNVIKFIYKLLKEFYPELVVSFGFRKQMKLYKNTEFLINILENSEVLLNDIEYDLLENKIPYSLQNSQAKIRGYITGVFLACGSCTDPISTNYHFEFRLKDKNYSQVFLKLISKIKSYHFEFKFIERRGKAIIYLKKSEQISSFLAYLNCENSCLNFEDVRVARDMSNSVNRMYNCDLYNYRKSLNNSKELLEKIDLIEKNIGNLKYITNDKLRELCLIKKEYPETSYEELAELLSKKFGKPISKSNVNHLVRKIKEIANKYEQ